MKQFLRLIMIAGAMILAQNNLHAQGTSRIIGQFTYTGPSGVPKLVNYGLSPNPPFTDVLFVTLNSTPDSTFFSMDVADSTGGIIMHWQPDSTRNTYVHSFDISSVAAGNYYIKIKDSTTEINSIPFSK